MMVMVMMVMMRMVMIHLLKHLCVHLRLGDHLLLLLAGDLELRQLGVVRRLFPLQRPQFLFVHIRLVESQYSLLKHIYKIIITILTIIIQSSYNLFTWGLLKANILS